MTRRRRIHRTIFAGSALFALARCSATVHGNDVTMLDATMPTPDGPRDIARDEPDAAVDVAPLDVSTSDTGARLDVSTDRDGPDATDATDARDATEASVDVFVPPSVISHEGPARRTLEPAPSSAPCLATTYGGAAVDQFQDLQVLTDGYILAGTTNADATSYLDGWLIRLDASGGVVWSRAIGGPWRDSFWSVAATGDGGFLAAGFAQVRGPAIDGESVAALLVRTDAAGTLLWSRYRLEPGASSRAVAAFETASGVAMVGHVTTTRVGTPDVFVSWHAADGTEIREQRYDIGNVDEVCAVARTSDGGMIVGGRTFTDYSSGEDTLFVVRLDATGGEVWRRMLGTTHTPWSAAGERLCAVIELPDGGAAITTADSLDPFAQSRRVVTLGPDGAPVRDRLYPDGNLRAGGIARAADDQLVVIGPSIRSTSGLDFDAVRLDDLGDVRWSAGYAAPDSDDPRVIRRTVDGSFLVAGTTYSVPGSSSQGWILRLTDDGTFTCLF